MNQLGYPLTLEEITVELVRMEILGPPNPGWGQVLFEQRHKKLTEQKRRMEEIAANGVTEY